MNKRIAIIGETGNGDYGHLLDQAFVSVEGAEIVALADPDEAGRKKHMEITGALTGYADYHEMFKTEKPDIAVIAPHELNIHLPMVLAAAEHGAHVYVEKPLAASVGAVDKMIEACDKAGVLLVTALPWRGHPEIQKQAIPLLKEGKIGIPQWARIHGPCPMWAPEYGDWKEYSGDAWMFDLFPHSFDFICQIFGTPLWCQSLITQDGRPASSGDLTTGIFGLKLTAGNGILAHYQFDGFIAEFVSILGSNLGQERGKATQYGIEIHGTKGTLFLPGAIWDGPDIYYHPHSHQALPEDDLWEVLVDNDLKGMEKWLNSHRRSARAMIDMIDGKTPEYELCLGPAARISTEMAIAARVAHIKGARVPFPLEEKGDPFETWK